MPWRDLRAALITVVLLCNALLALPSPGNVTEEKLANEVARDEIRLWQRVLAQVGIERSEDQIAQLATTWGPRVHEVRQALVAPLKPFTHHLKLNQRWALFTYPDTWPHYLVVEAKGGPGPWELVHRTHDREHDFLDEKLRYRRLRGYWSALPRKHSSRWKRFSRWLADQVFDAHPDYQIVRVRFERVQTTPPYSDEPPEVSDTRKRILKRKAKK